MSNVLKQGGTANPPSTGQAAQGGNTFYVPPGGGIPKTGDEWRALQRLRSELSDQITNVQSRRKNLADQLKNADPSARQGLIDRIKVIDERIVKLEQELDRTGEMQRNTPLSVVNVGLEARRLFPHQPVDLLLGGYHLAGAMVEDRIEATVRDLTNLVAPRIVAPGHCTGWRAAAALATAFSPSGCAPSVVGTRYLLKAL